MISANMQQKLGISVTLAKYATKGGKKRDFGEHATNKWDATFRVRNRSQRKVWQPIRAALAGNATLMEHSLGDQTALTNGLDQRP